MALPPFPPFPAAFGPMGAGAAGLYRAGHAGMGGGGGRGGQAAGAMGGRGGGMHRGYDNGEPWCWKKTVEHYFYDDITLQPATTTLGAAGAATPAGPTPTRILTLTSAEGPGRAQEPADP